MSSSTAYTKEFYSEIQEGSLRSARVILPLVVELVHPTSAVDVGCGTGTWLATLRALGVEDVVGVDGEYVERSALQIPAERFMAHDLETPLSLSRGFDLVLSLEVAEHLAPTAAPGFVESLTRLAPVVLFSAAIPMQGGVDHRNERWPAYWAAQFALHDFVPVDCIRQRVWGHPDVQPWYAQNVFLYVRRDALAGYPQLRPWVAEPSPSALVHPQIYMNRIHELQSRCNSVRFLLTALPGAIVRRIRARLMPEGRQ